MRADGQRRPRQLSAERGQKVIAVEKPCVRDIDYGPARMERPHDSIVLVAGNDGAFALSGERSDRDVDRVRRIHGQHDALRVLKMKK